MIFFVQVIYHFHGLMQEDSAIAVKIGINFSKFVDFRHILSSLVTRGSMLLVEDLIFQHSFQMRLIHFAFQFVLYTIDFFTWYFVVRACCCFCTPSTLSCGETVTPQLSEDLRYV